jgi:hypothetical protein
MQHQLGAGGLSMKLSAPIFQLKRRAKSLARDANIPLSAALDRLASNLAT